MKKFKNIFCSVNSKINREKFVMEFKELFNNDIYLLNALRYFLLKLNICDTLLNPLPEKEFTWFIAF